MSRKLILSIILVLLAFSCKRDVDIPDVSYTTENVNAEAFQTTCVITCKNESVDGTSVRIRVLIDKDKGFSSATQHEMSVSDDQWRCDVSGLTHGTKYYYCFELFSDVDTYRLKDVYDFTTSVITGISVTTSEITEITQTTAKGGGVVTSDSTAITERGICWSTSHNPTTSNSHAHNGTGEGNYSVNMTELNANTTYYVRAYAINSLGTTYGDEVSFTTLRIVTKPTVTTSQVTNITQTSATCGGNVTSDGDATVTERGVCWGTSHNPTTSNSHANSGTGTGSFTVNMTGLTANTNYYVRAYATNSVGTAYGEEVSFTTTSQQTNFTISVSASPSNGGTVSGGGTCQQGQSCTVRAVANNGYSFSKWTENGTQVSTNANYIFTVNGNRTLVANFNYNGGGNAPTGAINGLFTINSSGGKVYFSQGNLQYRSSSDSWAFAQNQWDFLGSNGQGSTNQNVDRDLFGWGTSGWHNSSDSYNVNYYPWSTSSSTVNESYNKYGYGPSTNMSSPDLTGSSSNYDWGMYNSISNGGNMSRRWRTLTRSEWDYVFNTRSTSSNIRFAKAEVNNISGVILLPDNWSNSYFALNNTNQSGASFSSNVISSTTWINSLQAHGAVFLPTAGRRYQTSVGHYDYIGYYWSASYEDSGDAYYLTFAGGTLDTGSYGMDRHMGFSVRLVQDY